MGLNGSEREGLGRGLAERERPVQCRGGRESWPEEEGAPEVSPKARQGAMIRGP